MTDEHQFTNRLIQETSPYLLQHAHNPVDWYPWGDEALARAREEDKPVLLSIGYSACHWCHVMERESFENERVADLMNESFVCVKVDREERPDIDDVYMAATLAMNNGQGGWPMTVFLTPTLDPVFAGTYFPPSDVPGRPGFDRILKGIAEAWKENRSGVLDGAAKFSEHLREQRSPQETLTVKPDDMEYARAQLADSFDSEWGGFGQPPKFPAAAALSFLLRVHHRNQDGQALQMVCKSLDAMAAGGIYDHLAGGFARYSTDREWLAPHFEKMLYDNALLSRVYAEAFQVTGNRNYERVLCETLDYIVREMTSPEGGFYSSTDADSEGIEGKFFVWTPEEIADVLKTPEAEVFCAYYDIKARGNWEGVSILRRLKSVDEVAGAFGMSPVECLEIVESAKKALYEAREKRVHPGLDDKILTSWNGMMIGAMAFGSFVMGRQDYLDKATAAADFLITTLYRDGKLLRTYRDGKAHVAGFLEDYAFLADGLIDLYEAGADEKFLKVAHKLAGTMISDYRNPTSGFFYSTSEDQDELPVRYHEGGDGATPSANAVAAGALLRLSRHFDDVEMKDAAVAAIEAYGHSIRRFPRVFARSLSVFDMLLDEPLEIALVGDRNSDGYRALAAEVAQHYLPNRIIGHSDPLEGGSDLPLLTGKEVPAGAAFFLCHDFACQAPTANPEDVRSALTLTGRTPDA